MIRTRVEREKSFASVALNVCRMRQNNDGWAFLTPSPIDIIFASPQRRRAAPSRCSAAPDEVILSVDLGTSLLKSALLNYRTGQLCSAVQSEAYPIHAASPFHATQKKADWDAALFSSASATLAHRPGNATVKAIAVTGQMQDMLATGASVPPLLADEVVLYSDARAIEEAECLSALTGECIQPTSLLAKLALLSTPPGSPSAESNTGYNLLFGGADYICSRLSDDVFVTDPTSLSTTGLSQAPHRAYDANLLEKAGMSLFTPLFPRIQPSLAIVDSLSSRAANKLGASDLAGTPLVHAGGDAATATFGAGVFGEGDGEYLYAGTSGWIGRVQDRRHLADDGASNGLFYLAHPHTTESELVLASMASACSNFDFASSILLGGIPLSEFDTLASTSPIGARGLTYIPYPSGRRCPRPSARATGSVVGLTSSTTRADVARAVVEGVAFAFRACADELSRVRGSGGEAKEAGRVLTVVGGGARSDVFLQALAGALGRRVRRGGGGEVGLRGAAYGAAVALREGAEVGWGRQAEKDDETLWVPREEEEDDWEAAWRRWLASVETMERMW